jgi:hypothetical protein
MIWNQHITYEWLVTNQKRHSINITREYRKPISHVFVCFSDKSSFFLFLHVLHWKVEASDMVPHLACVWILLSAPKLINKTNSVTLSPQANYTDWPTVTCPRNLVPNLWIKGCRVVSAADPLRSLISVFYTEAATFLSCSCSFILTKAEWTPFQTDCYSENLVAPGIEQGTSGSAARNSDH